MESKKFFLVLFFFLFSHIGYAQTSIDSLKAFVDSAPDSPAKLDAILSMAREMINGEKNESEKYLDEASRLVKEFPDSLKEGKLQKLFGQYYLFEGKYKKATKYFLSAIEIGEKIGDKELEESALNSLATLDIRTGNYEGGIKIFEKLLRKAKEEKDETGILMYSLNLASANGDAGKLEEASKYFKAIYNLNPNNKLYKAVAANGLSYILIQQGKYKQAANYAQKALEISKEVPDVAFRLEALTNYSNALKEMGNHKKAGEIIKQIIALAKKHKFIRKMNNAIGNLALNYAAMGNYKEAFKYYKEFAERKDSLLNESTSAKINELQIKYETAEKDRLLQEKADLIKRKNLALTFSIAGGVLFFLIAIVLVTMYRMKNRAYKELVKKNVEIIEKEEEIFSQKRRLAEGKYKTSSLSEEKKEKINEKLTEAINGEKVFLNSDISLGSLAQKLGINSKYLSQVIHEFYNLSFSDFINQLRIKEAAKMLSDETYSHISIEGISELVGFKSKSTFNTCFKKFTGVTPSFFASTVRDLKVKE